LFGHTTKINIMKFPAVFFLSLVNAQDGISLEMGDEEMVYIGGGGEAGHEAAKKEVLKIGLTCMIEAGAFPLQEQGPGGAPPPEHGHGGAPPPEHGHGGAPPPEHGHGEAPPPEHGHGGAPPPEQGPGGAPPPHQDETEIMNKERFEMECAMQNCFTEKAEEVDLDSKFKRPKNHLKQCLEFHTIYESLKKQHSDLKCTPAACSAAFFMKPVASIFVLILLLF